MRDPCYKLLWGVIDDLPYYIFLLTIAKSFISLSVLYIRQVIRYSNWSIGFLVLKAFNLSSRKQLLDSNVSKHGF
jgi:hypothetical protein